MKKIKILYTIPNFDTAGSGKALLNLALGLDKDRFEPHIVCLHDKGDFFKTVKESGIPVHVFNYLPKERPILKMLRDCWKVSRKFKAINPDIIHSFHYSSNYTEALAAKMAGIRWTFTKKNMSWGGSSANSWKLRSFLAQKIIVQNIDMEQLFYPKSNKTTLIPRGVVVDRFKAGEPKQEIKAAMNTLPQQRVLICVANLVPVKGIETLIEAFNKVHAEYTNWVLWVVGDDNHEYGVKLHELVSSLHLTLKVIFSGKQLNVVEYLNQSEIFVLPTQDKGEGSPVALLEAMANGKVVIGSNVPGTKDQLMNFPEHLFEAKNTNELADKLQHFMGYSKKDLEELGQQFYVWVANNYSIASEITKHEKFYFSLL